MTKSKTILATMFSLIAMLVACSASSAAGTKTVNFYKGKVVAFNGPLIFQLDCCKQALEITLVRVVDHSKKNVAKIEALLHQHELSCTSFGFFSQDIGTTTQAVWCNVETGELISALLMQQKLVKERCEYSKNQFGTC